MNHAGPARWWVAAATLLWFSLAAVRAPAQQAPSAPASSEQAPSEQAPSEQAPSEQAPSEQAQSSAAAQSWPRILWLTDGHGAAPDIADAVRSVGCNGINVTNGAPPDLAAGTGLLRLLDQPAGKGVLELTEAQYAPDRDCYESDRSIRCLTRPTCLVDPEVLTELAIASADRVRAVQSAGPLVGVLLADEASFTRHGNPLDYDFSPGSLERFRQDALGLHGSIGGIQQAWEVDAATLQQLLPPTTDQVRNRFRGESRLPANMAAWAAFRRSNDRQLADAVAAMRVAVAKALGDPTAPQPPIGLGGVQTPAAFGGHHYARLLPGLSLLETYDIGGARDLAMCLADPGARHWQTVFPGDLNRTQLTAEIAEGLAHGVAGLVVWSSGNVLRTDPDGGPDGNAAADLQATEAGERLRRVIGDLAPVAAACAGARMARDAVWVVESQASVQAWWMLDSWRDGRTWNRRRTSYEASHSTSQATRESWLRLLGDLGIQPRFVAAERLRDELRRARPKVMVLGAAVALEDAAVLAVESYCLGGGTVLADHSLGLYDGELRLLEQPALDRMFGLRRGARRHDSLHVQEGQVSARLELTSGLRAAELGLDGPVPEVIAAGVAVAPGSYAEGRLALDESGAPVPPDRLAIQFEQPIGRGRAIYLNLAVCTYRDLRLQPAQVAAAKDLRQRVRRVLDRAGVQPPVLVSGEGLPTLVELTRLLSPQGRRVLTVRLDHRNAPNLLPQLNARGPRPIEIRLRRPARVVDLRTGDVVGEGDRLEWQLDPVVGLFLELLPMRSGSDGESR